MKKTFDGNLCKYTGSNYYRIKGTCKVLWYKAISNTNNSQSNSQKKAERLIKKVIYEKINNYQSATPSVIILKKNGTVRFISDFRLQIVVYLHLYRFIEIQIGK